MGQGRRERANELRGRAETHLISAGWLSARELLEDALVLYREEKDAAGEVHCLRGLGDVALKLDELDVAASHYGEALECARVAGDRAGEGECRFRQGDLARARGRADEARGAFEEARVAFAEAGDRKGEAQCLGLLGEIAREAGAPRAEVMQLFRGAHAAQMEIGDLRGAAVTLTFIANFLKDADPPAAADAFVQAARIYEGLGLTHRSEPFLAAARRLDPANAPPRTVRPPGPWDTDD